MCSKSVSQGTRWVVYSKRGRREMSTEDPGGKGKGELR